MTSISFTKQLEKKADLLKLGFLPVKKWEGSNLFRYHRKSENRIDLLGISIFSYSQTKREKGIFIGYEHFVKGVSFLILNRIFEKSKIEVLLPSWYNEEEYYNGDIILSSKHPNWKKPFNKYPSISENLLTYDKKIDERKTEEACQILRDIIESQILPFYDLYPNLQSVNDEIINQFGTAKELSGYISGQIGFKKMAILSLCNNPSYCEYISDYEERLKKGVKQSSERYLPYLEFFYRLKDVLESHSKNGNLKGDQV